MLNDEFRKRLDDLRRFADSADASYAKFAAPSPGEKPVAQTPASAASSAQTDSDVLAAASPAYIVSAMAAFPAKKGGVDVSAWAKAVRKGSFPRP